MGKYTVDYVSGATGYGWTQDFDRLDEFEDFINEMRYVYTAKVLVFDNKLGDFIYWKDCLTINPRIDMLHSISRDMRTRTRKWQ